MLAPELVDELRTIAYCEVAKPKNRVSALNSLMKNNEDTVKVRATLYGIATDIHTPDDVKVRAIDLLSKLDTAQAPKELSAEEIATAEQSLMEMYVGTTNPNTRTI